MKILELSSLNDINILPATIKGTERKHVIKFNPSLARLEGNIFVLTYRVFVASAESRKPGFTPTSNSHSGTPWGSEWDSDYDGTGVAFLRYDQPSRNFFVVQDSILPVMDNVVESRICNDGQGILLSYYAFQDTCKFISQDRSSSVELCGNKSRACEFKYVTRINFQKEKNGISYSVLKPFIVCPSQNTYIKESSGIFKLNSKFYFQDDMMSWSFLEYKHKNKCTILHPENSVYFYKLSTWYDGSVKFHPSTPLVPYSDGELLGVGYAQMDFWRIAELIEQQTLRNTKYFEEGGDVAQLTAQSKPDNTKPIHMEEYAQSGAADFMRDIQSLFNLPDFKDVSEWSKYKEGHLHHRHFNFMFFYTVDPLNLQLQRFSFCFYPRPPSSTISTYVIPCGVELVETNVIAVSYGSSHTTSNIMLMNRAEVNKKLKYTPTDNPHLNQYPFMYTNH